MLFTCCCLLIMRFQALAMSTPRRIELNQKGGVSRQCFIEVFSCEDQYIRCRDRHHERHHCQPHHHQTNRKRKNTWRDVSSTSCDVRNPRMFSIHPHLGTLFDVFSSSKRIEQRQKSGVVCLVTRTRSVIEQHELFLLR